MKKILCFFWETTIGGEVSWLLEEKEKEKEYEIEVVNSLHRLADTLEEEKTKIALIIIDIVHPYIEDLADIGKPEIKSKEGFIGWEILKHFLREENSPYRHIPVLILTVKTLTKKEKRLMQKLKIEGYIELNAPGWEKEFKKFIKRIGL